MLIERQFNYRERKEFKNLDDYFDYEEKKMVEEWKEHKEKKKAAETEKKQREKLKEKENQNKNVRRIIGIFCFLNTLVL